MRKQTKLDIIVIEALKNVNQNYYSTVYKNIEEFKSVFLGRNGRMLETDFERFSERVFCYEFYHQLRILIDNEKSKNPSFLSGTLLQGEVRKMMIIELVEKFGLEGLSGEFIPDFLIHGHDNSDKQHCVIEVKCIKNLSQSAFIYDLKKINEFVTKYRYENGYFISVNTQSKLIEDLLNEGKSEINFLEGKNNIKIFCKEKQDTEPTIWEL
jgi:hypothetical protein